MRRFAGTLIAITLLGNALGAQQAKPSMPQPQEQSLYQRLGGAYPIAVVVDDFIDRVLADDVLNANPAIREARSRVPAAGLKFHVTSLVCAVTGGPCKYVGRGMQEAHAHLNITEREWQAMIGDFKVTLDRFKVPAREQGELIKIVESTKGQIVAAGAAR